MPAEDQIPASAAPAPPAPPEPIVGIDLGTTNSLVAYCDAAGPHIIPDEQGRPLLPSVVRFDPATGEVRAIGHEARTHAVEHPRETVFSIKRLMGRGLADLRDELPHLPYEVVPGAHNTARVQIGPPEAARVFSPQEISALILRRLRDQAQRHFGRPVRKAVITVPAYFDDAQRQATRDAGRLAGLEVVRIVNEPTAASLAYNLGLVQHRRARAPSLAPQCPSKGKSASLLPIAGPPSSPAAPRLEDADDTTVAVFDLGGGTFDFSILRLQHTDSGLVDQVLGTAGDTHLGGDDVDRMIVELIQGEICHQLCPAAPNAPSRSAAEVCGFFPPATRQAFRNLAEAAKIRLSTEESATIEIDMGVGPENPKGLSPSSGTDPFDRQAPADSTGQSKGSVPDPSEDSRIGDRPPDRPHRIYRRTITRAELEAMIAPWVERALACCRRALAAAKLAPTAIQRVILVGGSTRIPLVRHRVAELFGGEPYTALNPDEVVALGAAVQAAILSGVHRDMLLLDVIPLSLGIETLGGAVAKLILANSTIPARATEMFSTYVDGQTNIKIHVLQGERELVKDCRSLGEFQLRGIPPMPAGLPKLEVTFLVDANGILNVTAIERRSEKAASIQIVPNHGLTRDEVTAIEKASFAHAREDMTAHRLIDLRNQARLDLRAIQRQLAKVGVEVDPAYRAAIDQKVAAVQQHLDAPSPDADAFAAALRDLDHATVRLAELAIARTLREDAAPK